MFCILLRQFVENTFSFRQLCHSLQQLFSKHLEFSHLSFKNHQQICCGKTYSQLYARIQLDINPVTHLSICLDIHSTPWQTQRLCATRNVTTSSTMPALVTTNLCSYSHSSVDYKLPLRQPMSRSNKLLLCLCSPPRGVRPVHSVTKVKMFSFQCKTVESFIDD